MAITQLSQPPIAPALMIGTPLTGQQKIALTGTAVQLTATSTPLLNGVILTALSGNAAAITLGGSTVTNTVDGTGNGYVLAAGASISCAIDDISNLYVNGTAGDIVTWMGS